MLLTILPGGTSWGAVASGFLAGTLVTLLVLLRKLDRLRWHERVSIWEPTTRLFRNIGLDPYVPREVIDAGRYRPAGTVRVVDYPDPYPVRSTKQVTVVELDGKGPTHRRAEPGGPTAERAAGERRAYDDPTGSPPKVPTRQRGSDDGGHRPQAERTTHVCQGGGGGGRLDDRGRGGALGHGAGPAGRAPSCTS